MATFWIPSQQVNAVDLNRMFSAGTFSFTYDNDGKMLTAVDALTTTTYTMTYDLNDRLSTVTDAVNTWTLTWNDDDEVTNVVVT